MRKEDLPESKNVEDRFPKVHPAADLIRDLFNKALGAVSSLPYANDAINDVTYEQHRQKQIKDLETEKEISATRLRPLTKLVKEQQQHLRERALAHDMARSLAGQDVPLEAAGNLPGNYGYGHYPDDKGGYDYHKPNAPDSLIQIAASLLFQTPFGKKDKKTQEFLDNLLAGIK